MTRTEHLLTILAEECAEVAQRASKAARFGMSEVQPGQGDDNKRRLEKELADLLGVAELLELGLDTSEIVAKKKKVKKYMDYARKMGTLE